MLCYNNSRTLVSKILLIIFIDLLQPSFIFLFEQLLSYRLLCSLISALFEFQSVVAFAVACEYVLIIVVVMSSIVKLPKERVLHYFEIVVQGLALLLPDEGIRVAGFLRH